MKFAFRPRLTTMVCMLSLFGSAVHGDSASPTYNRRWTYVSTYLVHNANADRVISTIQQAAAAGYNGVMLNEWGLNSLATMPPSYFGNVSRVVSAAKAAGVEIIPCVFPVGYSEGLLKHDPNLAEGVPVEKAPFIVRQGAATPASANVNLISNGGFEQTTDGNTFVGYLFQDLAVTADRTTAVEGSASMHAVSDGWMSRICQRVSVRPRAAYRLTAWVKTSGLQPAGNFYFYAMGADGRVLNYNETLVSSNQDWTKVSVVFNSLNDTRVSVYGGLWFAQTGGQLWMDDLRLEEIGPINILRRGGCPIRVTSADGRTRYKEGVDFEPLVDPLLGEVPYAGNYDYNHEAPRLILTPKSRIREGQTLLVNWYHPPIIYGYQVTCCLSEPKVYELLKDQARRVIDLFHPKTVMMGHDEIRVANWCSNCRASGGSAGDLLGRHTGRCVRIIKDFDPTIRVAVWSDMFDPFHNAINNYYLVNGNLAGSWDDLDPSVTIVNWNSGHAAESLEFFSSLGVSQVIAGYYDSYSLDNFTLWDLAARGVPGVDGFMYSTFYGDYSWLGAYGKAIRRQP